MPTTNLSPIDAYGQWVVIDPDEEGASLLAVGDTEYEGISPKNWLDERSGSVLLKKLRNSLHFGEGFEGVALHRGTEYVVVTKPIWSPDHKQVVGAKGIFALSRATVPEEPKTGAWQWRVDHKGRNVGEDSSRWDGVLFEIYGIAAEMISSRRGPAGEWLNKLIASKDRHNIKLIIDSGVDANNRKRHLLSYEITYGYGSPNPGKRQIRNSARAYDDPDYPDAIMLRGFSRAVASPTMFMTPGLSPIPTGLIPDAIFALASDRAFAAIDLPQDTTFQTSASWASLGLQPNFENNIAALAHPDDKTSLEDYLQAIARGNMTPGSVISPRLRTTFDAWRAFDITASRIDTDEQPSRYLMISLIPKKETDEPSC